jgi:putative tryptophan/tyrosine transport system substrate-binding protein
MQFDQLKRREFITLLGGAAVARPVAARGQQTVLPVIGFLHPGSPEANAKFVAGFRKGLAETGYAEGRNIAIEYRWGHGASGRLPELVADLISRPVAVIVTPGSVAAALAAKAATATIPIVYAIGVDPVQAGLGASLARPGGKVTGASFSSTGLGAKALGLLHQIAPEARIVGLLFNPSTLESARQPTDAQAGACARARTPGVERHQRRRNRPGLRDSAATTGRRARHRLRPVLRHQARSSRGIDQTPSDSGDIFPT